MLSFSGSDFLTEVNEGICDFLIVRNNEKEIFRDRSEDENTLV